MQNKFIFRALALSDVPLMHKWFNLPHVQKFYSLRNWTELEVLEEYRPYINGDKPVSGFIAFINEKPIGYIQQYKFSGYPLPDQSLPDEIINHAAGMDLFIGDQSLIGRNIGSEMMMAFIKNEIWSDFQYCIVDPNINNLASIRCCEKLNFQAYGDIEIKDAIGQPATVRLMVLKINN
jgi:aminoglycoside 6'-N-acetyltransferase